mmetsp:Transcript_17972/g.40834  ORF Transcript_17972/g.40834 Transcript_17972/m.40834 type:complete len:453 (-) Transcript_17972:1259-2617(-)
MVIYSNTIALALCLLLAFVQGSDYIDDPTYRYEGHKGDEYQCENVVTKYRCKQIDFYYDELVVKKCPYSCRKLYPKVSPHWNNLYGRYFVPTSAPTTVGNPISSPLDYIDDPTYRYEGHEGDEYQCENVVTKYRCKQKDFYYDELVVKKCPYSCRQLYPKVSPHWENLYGEYFVSTSAPTTVDKPTVSPSIRVVPRTASLVLPTDTHIPNLQLADDPSYHYRGLIGDQYMCKMFATVYQCKLYDSYYGVLVEEKCSLSCRKLYEPTPKLKLVDNPSYHFEGREGNEYLCKNFVSAYRCNQYDNHYGVLVVEKCSLSCWKLYKSDEIMRHRFGEIFALLTDIATTDTTEVMRRSFGEIFAPPSKITLANTTEAAPVFTSTSTQSIAIQPPTLYPTKKWVRCQDDPSFFFNKIRSPEFDCKHFATSNFRCELLDRYGTLVRARCQRSCNICKPS